MESKSIVPSSKRSCTDGHSRKGRSFEGKGDRAAGEKSSNGTWRSRTACKLRGVRVREIETTCGEAGGGVEEGLEVEAAQMRAHATNPAERGADDAEV